MASITPSRNRSVRVLDEKVDRLYKLVANRTDGQPNILLDRALEQRQGWCGNLERQSNNDCYNREDNPCHKYLGSFVTSWTAPSTINACNNQARRQIRADTLGFDGADVEALSCRIKSDVIPINALEYLLHDTQNLACCVRRR